MLSIASDVMQELCALYLEECYDPYLCCGRLRLDSRLSFAVDWQQCRGCLVPACEETSCVPYFDAAAESHCYVSHVCRGSIEQLDDLQPHGL